MRKPKVVVTFIEAGMGHIVSAKAIAEALQNRYGNEIEVVEQYVCKENDVLSKFEKYLVKEVKRMNKMPGYSNLQFAAMHILTPQGTLKFTHSTVFKKIKEAMCAEIEELAPDLIVNTHYAPLHFAVELRNKKLHNLVVATYDPDPNVHGWWDNRGDLFLVNNHAAFEEAVEKCKFNPNNVKEVNFTTRDMIVNSNLTKAEYREKLGIPVDQFTVALADGAYATAKCKAYTNELLKSKKNMTLLVIAGKNKKVYDYFVELKEEGKVPSNITLMPYEFVTNAHELYAAADIFVTKAGPNAIQDSLFMGTPVLVNYYASMIEKVTQKLFVKYYKCGETILDKIKARKRIEKWINNREQLDIYTQNCKQFDKTKNGSLKAADEIYRALRYYRPELFED